MDYPEHEKRAEVKENIQIIGDFLHWLDQKRIVLGKWTREDVLAECIPINKSFDDLIYEYFDVDRDRIELESRELLEAVRLQDRF